MLLHSLTALLLGSGGLAVLAAPQPSGIDLDPDFTVFDISDQVPFGAPAPLEQEFSPEVLEQDAEPEDDVTADEETAKHPHPPHHRPPKKGINTTIYGFLNTNPKFSRLAKVVNISDEAVSLLNDTSANLTFFALPNWAIPHPHKKPKKDSNHLLNTDISAHDLLSLYDFPELVSAVEELHDSSLYAVDEDGERRHAFLKKLVTAILGYHVIPQGLEAHHLAENSTFATNLTLSDGSLDGEPLRLKFSTRTVPPTLKVNLFSKVIVPNINTTNGFIHVINAPLLPLPSIFAGAFGVPSVFSYASTALQHSGLTDSIHWRYVPGSEFKEGALQGSPATTFFAPTNSAFKKLPAKLRLFLFSPFGGRALKKLLQFHIVPEFILHADYLHNASSSADASVFPASSDDSWAEDLDVLDMNQWVEDLATFYNPKDQLSLEELDESSFYSEALDDVYGAEPGVDELDGWLGSKGNAAYAEDGILGSYKHVRKSHGAIPISRCAPPPPPYRRRGGPNDVSGPSHLTGPCFSPLERPFLYCNGPLPHLAPEVKLEALNRMDVARDARSHNMPTFEMPKAQPGSEYDGRRTPLPPRPGKPDHRPPPPPPRGPHEPHGPPPSPGPHSPHSPPAPPGPPGRHGPHRPHPRPPPPGPCKPRHHAQPKLPHFPPVSSVNVTLPTLLTNASLHVHVAKFKFTLPIPGPHKPAKFVTKFFVNGQSVSVYDVPSRNGAVHVVGKLLNPRPHPPPHRKVAGDVSTSFMPESDEEYDASWEDWEDWLHEWAAED